MSALSMLMVGCIVVTALWLLYRRYFGIEAWVPAELRSAKVSMVERNLFVQAPRRIACRVDRVYRLANGLHVPIEFKNHDSTNVYESDKAQLALQGWILRQNGFATADHGYVLVRPRRGGKLVATRVSLAGDQFCERLIERYVALRYGQAIPRKASGRKCDQCGHRAPCQRAK